MLDNTNRVSKSRIEELIAASEVHVETLFDKCTLLALKLPNGFVITSTSGCIDPNNYSEAIGVDICLDHIRDELWKLEGYVATNEFSAKKELI